MGNRIGDLRGGGVGFSDNFSAGVTVEKKTGTVSITAATVDGFINSLNRNDGEQPAFSRQSVKAAVDGLKAQQAQQGGAKTAVYQTIKGENGKEKFVGLDKDGNLTLQDVGKSSRPGAKGPVQTQIVLSEKAKALVLESESAKFAQERAGKPEAALKEVTVGGKQFLFAADKEGNSYKSEVQMSAPKKGKSFSAGAFLKSPPKLDEKFQSVVIEASINKLQEQRAGGATGDLVKALEYNGMNKLVALRANGKTETIDFSAYKAKNGTEALAVDKAIQELREWQAVNPGQEASKKIKINKKISFNITLNADGSIKDIKRKKKKKQGFFAKIGSFFKKALQVLSIATMFIPGLQPIALGLRIANAVVGVVDAVKNKNWLGVLGSAAGAFGGSLANTITKGINTIGTVVNVAKNGIGSAWDAISTVAGTVSSWAGGAIGRTAGYISQGASAISSFARGDGWNGAIALGNLAGSAYQDSRAANQRQQASSNNRDTQNDQLMISVDQPLPGTAPVDRVRQAYEGIYGRMNDRQNAVTQLITENLVRRGIPPTPANINRERQFTNNLLAEQRNLGVDGLRAANDARRGINTQTGSIFSNRPVGSLGLGPGSLVAFSLPIPSINFNSLRSIPGLNSALFQKIAGKVNLLLGAGLALVEIKQLLQAGIDWIKASESNSATKDAMSKFASNVLDKVSHGRGSSQQKTNIYRSIAADTSLNDSVRNMAKVMVRDPDLEYTSTANNSPRPNVGNSTLTYPSGRIEGLGSNDAGGFILNDPRLRSLMNEPLVTPRGDDGLTTNVFDVRISKPAIMNSNWKQEQLAQLLAANPNANTDQLRQAYDSLRADNTIHHIIPDNVVRNHPLADFARTEGYDLDRTSNLIGLNKQAVYANPATRTTAIGHWSQHPNYDRVVGQLLDDAVRNIIGNVPAADIRNRLNQLSETKKQEVMQEMEKVEDELRRRFNNGTVPNNGGRVSDLPDNNTTII